MCDVNKFDVYRCDVCVRTYTHTITGKNDEVMIFNGDVVVAPAFVVKNVNNSYNDGAVHNMGLFRSIIQQWFRATNIRIRTPTDLVVIVLLFIFFFCFHMILIEFVHLKKK